MVRLYSDLDNYRIKKIWEKYYKYSFEYISPEDINVFCRAITTHVKDDKHVLTGFGLVRNIAEVIMMLDRDEGKLTNGKDLLDLITNAALAAKIEGHDSIHAFVQDKDFSELLKKHFGFKNCVGEALVLNLER